MKFLLGNKAQRGHNKGIKKCLRFVSFQSQEQSSILIYSYQKELLSTVPLYDSAKII